MKETSHIECCTFEGITRVDLPTSQDQFVRLYPSPLSPPRLSRMGRAPSLFCLGCQTLHCCSGLRMDEAIFHTAAGEK